MNETLTLTDRDQQRLRTVNHVLEGTLTGQEAADVLGVGVRQLRRVVARYRCEGAAAIPHHNRGRAPGHTIPAHVRDQIVTLSQTTYAGANDSHLRDLLAEREGIDLSLSTIQRIRRAADETSPRQRRPAQHRQRRERRAQEGMLLQIDGSPHAWLEDRGPRLTLLAAIDDATGTIAGAVWRAQEDSDGYLALLEQLVTQHGCPEAVYHDRSGIFVHHAHERETVAEQLAGERDPRQVARAFRQLGIASIIAHSPQAKGRVERLFNTLQDRLVVELRLAQATTHAEADAVLAAYLPRFNARFGVPAATPGRAYHPIPAGVVLRQVCCRIERRVVANDDTVSFAGDWLQLLPGTGRASYVKATVEIRQHLDGTQSLWHEERELAWRPAPSDPRAQRPTRAPGRREPSSVPTPTTFNFDAEERATLAPAPTPPDTTPTPPPKKRSTWNGPFIDRPRT